MVAVGATSPLLPIGYAVTLAANVLLTKIVAGPGAMPKAIPLRCTVCGLFSASSVMVRVPGSFVPLGLLALLGLNVTDTVQVAGLGASVEPQVFALTAKDPLGVIDVMPNALLLGFDSVTILGADTVAT